MGRQETPTTNRCVAEWFCAHYLHPDLTGMRFSREGGRPAPGAGWRVNVVVTVGSDEYNEILDSDGWIGDPLPKGPTEASGRSVLVTYSDQSTEVLG